MNTCTWNIGNSIPDEAKSQLISMLSKYKSEVFTGLGCAVEHPYELKLIDNADLSKVKTCRLRSNPKINAEIESQVKTMLHSGVIERSSTHVLSPIVLARKRDGNFRFCPGFRSLNTQIQDEVSR